MALTLVQIRKIMLLLQLIHKIKKFIILKIFNLGPSRKLVNAKVYKILSLRILSKCKTSTSRMLPQFNQ